MFRIGDFSRLARVTIKTLHHYDEAGLLTPAHVDHLTGYRYYAAAQLETLQRILLLKDLGFSLEEIRELLAAGFDSPLVTQRLQTRRAQLRIGIEAEEARLRRLDALCASLAGGSPTSPPAVTLRDLPAVEVHGVRRSVASLGPAVHAMFEAAEAEVARARARADASPFLVFHDHEYREENADVEVCIPVKPGSPSHLRVRTVPGAAAGCVTYQGPYEQTPLLYEAMLRWIARSGFALAGPLREVYHRFGADQSGYRLPEHVLAATSSEYVTELQAPVAPLIQQKGE
jgi:DNA-binding transcriptional MerR regulator/effector-binding domain-containing protein